MNKGKIIIEITDKEDGSVSVKFNPSIKELMSMNENALTGAHCYAAACASACKKLSDEMKDLDPEQSKEKSKIWVPAIKKLIFGH